MTLNPARLAHFTHWVTTLPLRPLPRTVTPLAGEYHVGYVGRLAEANHLEFGELAAALSDTAAITAYSPRGWRRHEQERLAAAASQPLARIARLWWPDPRVYLRGPEGFRKMLRPACRRCAVRVGITGPVACHLPPHQTLCRRHRLWTGPAARSIDGQLDVSHLPGILRTHRRHCYLVRACDHLPWQPGDAIHDATSAVHRAIDAGAWTPHQQQRLRHLAPATWPQLTQEPHAWWHRPSHPRPAAIEIAIYPDVIQLAADSLRALITATPPAWASARTTGGP